MKVLRRIETREKQEMIVDLIFLKMSLLLIVFASKVPILTMIFSANLFFVHVQIRKEKWKLLIDKLRRKFLAQKAKRKMKAKTQQQIADTQQQRASIET